MENKKIGLSIVYDYPDYGSMLQSYATQYILTKLGFKSEAININKLKRSINKRKILYFAQNIFDISIVREKFKLICKKSKKITDKNFAEKQRLRTEALRKFSKDKFIISREYKSWKDLEMACNNYSAVLVGSDQLWLPSNAIANYYTLSFVPPKIKKICYATSFGIAQIPNKYKSKYNFFLNRFQYLSAREISGQKIIKELTKREVPLVCDPALLLDRDNWDEIATPRRIIREKYIFCYFMGDNPEHRIFAKKLATKKGYKIVSLLHLDQYIQSDEEYADYTPYDISPADFINLIKNAEYICTDSFHGTIFSIIYSKDFFTFKRFNKKASLSTNTRIFSLLNKLELTSRLYSGNENININLHINNYNIIQNIVSNFRKESISYLKNALDN